MRCQTLSKVRGYAAERGGGLKGGEAPFFYTFLTVVLYLKMISLPSFITVLGSLTRVT